MEFGDLFAGWFALLVLWLPFALLITIVTAWVAALVAAVSPLVVASGAAQKG